MKTSLASQLKYVTPKKFLANELEEKIYCIGHMAKPHTHKGAILISLGIVLGA